MDDRRTTMIDPPIEDLLDKVDSKFTLVTLSAKRGREVNSYFNQLGEGLGSIVPPQVTSVSRKPLSIALEEIAAGKIRWVSPEEQEELAAQALEAEAAAAADAAIEGGTDVEGGATLAVIPEPNADEAGSPDDAS
ncbi:MAG: DNA-directed RNA polymerase subunit omega [Acidimicrobiales bacterium]